MGVKTVRQNVNEQQP